VPKAKHLDLLRRDVDAWNSLREADPGLVPDLSQADLTGADLTLANLSGALLIDSTLVLANLRGADLRAADLTRANLVGARLLGVDLVGANLSGADLSTAEDLTQEDIDQTLGDENTALPEGIQRPAHWLGIRKVNLQSAFARFTDHWQPRIVGDLHGVQIKIVKLLGEFVWHHHEEEDELFLVVKGQLLMRFRDREIRVDEGEFLIVPRGVEHQSVAEHECEVLLIEPGTTVNTGNIRDERTVLQPRRLT
jgi:mannose-6-phosphate isomerase-like protein (cupin superfamily)